MKYKDTPTCVPPALSNKQKLYLNSIRFFCNETKSPLTVLIDNLNDRIGAALKSGSIILSTQLTLPTRSRFGKVIQDPQSIARQIVDCFIDGHMHYLNRTTTSPLIMISLFAKNEISMGKTKQINWMTPIEYPLICQNLLQYRQMMALLKGWGAGYSDLALIVIPAGTEIEGWIGLVGPQALPKPNMAAPEKYFDRESYVDVKKVYNILQICNNVTLEPKNFFEQLAGGATQIRLLSAPGAFVIHLSEAITYKNGEPLPNYVVRSEGMKWVRDPNNTDKENKFSPLVDPDYDSAIIDLPMSLKNHNIIDQREHSDIQRIKAQLSS